MEPKKSTIYIYSYVNQWQRRFFYLGHSYNFTSVSEDLTNEKLLIRFRRVILHSNRASLIPTQLRGPAPNGRWQYWGRLAFCSAENLLKKKKLLYNHIVMDWLAKQLCILVVYPYLFCVHVSVLFVPVGACGHTCMRKLVGAGGCGYACVGLWQLGACGYVSSGYSSLRLMAMLGQDIAAKLRLVLICVSGQWKLLQEYSVNIIIWTAIFIIHCSGVCLRLLFFKCSVIV